MIEGEKGVVYLVSLEMWPGLGGDDDEHAVLRDVVDPYTEGWRNRRNRFVFSTWKQAT
jgi:hypothetical protein